MGLKSAFPKSSFPKGSKDWVEADFNPATLELARMSKLLEHADIVMVQVKCGQEKYMRSAYALLTQVLDYFYFILEPAHKKKLDSLKFELNKVITLVEKRLMLNQKRGKELPIGSPEEVTGIDLLVKFQSLIYQYKGILGLGIVFSKRMASEDILDNALGIANLDKEVEKYEEDDVSEEELGEMPEEEQKEDVKENEENGSMQEM